MRGRQAWCLAVIWAAAALAAAALAAAAFATHCRAEAPPSMVRDDWYLRESLAAIRDWDAILARLEKTPPLRASVPAFPVPENGVAVAWPNPVPRELLPRRDRGATLTLRLIDGGRRLEWSGSRGAPTSVTGDLRADRGDPPGPHTQPVGEPLVTYRHFGGGGRDQWYHSYQRRFDRLLALTARAAPLAVSVAPFDSQRGRRTLSVTLRNVAAKARELAAEVTLVRHDPIASSEPARQSVRIAAGKEARVEFPVELAAEGGGLLVVSVRCEGVEYWMTVLTHVERASAVLQSVAQMLSDVPDAAGSLEAARLAAEVAPWNGPAAGDRPQRRTWRAVFDDACRLRDRLLLARLPMDSMLLVKRKPWYSEQPFMDAHHLFNRPGGGVYKLSPVRPGGRLTPVVASLGEGVYRDVCLHWNADRLLFAFGNGSDKWRGDPSYHIYEATVDGRSVRQLTRGPKNDCEPFYMPGDRIGFTSDRSEHFVMCGGDRHSPTLFAAEADGSQVRQLSFNVFNDFNPSMLPDGRILYSRWEYNERSVTSLHNPFTMNPDGTMVQPFYGNATIRPNVVMFPRPVPGSRKVMALFTAHHGQTHGSVALLDTRRGVDGADPIELLTPGVPVTAEKIEDSKVGWFSDPAPLSEDLWLCSYTPTILPWLEWTWAVYAADRRGNLALIYRDAEISCAEPVPLVRRDPPHERPGADPNVGREDAEATLYLADVYRGLGVPRGTVTHLRVLEDVPRKSVDYGGVVCTSGTLIFTIKRVLGVVPVAEDGSAYFIVPANRNVYFEALGSDGCEVQRMRSVVCLKPGESRSCIGCHEPRNMAPPSAATVNSATLPAASALRGRPTRPVPPPWGTRTLSYLRDVQPVLNARCVQCHTHDRETNKVILTDDLTQQFCIGYEELLPYLKVAVSNRWDLPEDVLPRPPYTYGSKASPLSTLLDKGHYGVKLTAEERQRLLTWIDANGVYYDTYETSREWPNRQIFSNRWLDEAMKIGARRCAACHSNGDDRFGTWLSSINRRDVRQSRALAAPLAKSAGGWGRCSPTVFADDSDPDYQALLALWTDLDRRLKAHPREDVFSLRGDPAESQAVALPPPPPPRPTDSSATLPPDWVHLSDLPWLSAKAGWSKKQDGLPLRDRDAEGTPIRVAGKRRLKGIGTHANSEIVYELGGGYTRFQAEAAATGQGGSVTFEVYGDDRLLAQTGKLLYPQSRPIDVSVAGMNRLRLVVTDASDGITADCAVWASARLKKK